MKSTTEQYIEIVYDRMANLPADVIVSLKNQDIHGFADLPNMVEINYVEVPEELRGQGYGSTVIQILTQTADEMGVTLVLTVAEALDDEGWPMSSGELSAWYERYGFLGDRKMIRYPHRSGNHSSMSS